MPRKQRLSARYRSGGLRQKAGVQDPKMLKKKELLAKARDRAERRATQATSEPAAPPCDVQAQLNDHCRNDNICSRELSTQQKHVNKRKKMRHSRDARRASTSFDANIDAVSAAVLPAGLGASAQTRCAPWAKDGRSESATMQAAERAIRQLLVILRKRLAKGRADQAAAMLGGLLRAPDIRPLLTAAGCMLTEDSTLDTHIVNQGTKCARVRFHVLVCQGYARANSQRLAMLGYSATERMQMCWRCAGAGDARKSWSAAPQSDQGSRCRAVVCCARMCGLLCEAASWPDGHLSCQSVRVLLWIVWLSVVRWVPW